jgi:UDP:flavonoid glycosyltransferase YjiC (YdhE family)
MTMTGRPRRMLMVSWDGGGNVPPLRALARALVRRGHEVHALGHRSTADRFAADGAIFHPLSGEPPFSAAHPRTAEEEIAHLVETTFFSTGILADFNAAVAELNPDLLLIDDLLLSVLQHCADLSVPTVPLHHMVFDTDTMDLFVKPFLAQVGGRAAGLDAAGFLELFPATLVFGYRAFSPQETLAPGVHFVGPVREAVNAPPWPRRLPDRPFVLVSLSTSFQNQHATLQRICDALAPLEIEALVTTGPNVALGSLSVGGGVELRDFVPHDEVIPSADLVITHAGHGTVCAAAGAGVPMLCLPMGRDQPGVAQRVEALSLGRSLSPDISAEAIGAAVMALLADDAQRAESRAFAASVNRFGDAARAMAIVERVGGSASD